ncbi:MAG: hypothetical protein ABIG11_02285 [bacterium]
MKVHPLLLFFLSLVSLPCSVHTAAAGVDIAGIEWQIARQNAKSRKPAYVRVKEWPQGPVSKTPGRIRIAVTLANRGAKAMEGTVLRYAVSMRLTKTGAPASSGVWMVPFWQDECRVPKIASARSREVKIPHIDLQGGLRKLRGTGFWPDMLKVQVMLEPRSGDSLENNVRESTIPVVARKIRP